MRPSHSGILFNPVKHEVILEFYQSFIDGTIPQNPDFDYYDPNYVNYGTELGTVNFSASDAVDEPDDMPCAGIPV